MPDRSASPAAAPTPGATSPMFYTQPVALSAERHAGLRLKPAGGFGFARRTNAIPLTVHDVADAVASYPIVFSLTPEPAMFAVVGLADGRNLFVGPDGRWRPSCHVPGYVRRYPFIFAHEPVAGRYTLCVDAPAIAVDGTGGALFGDGDEPGPAVREALAFCQAFQTGLEQARAFVSGLAAAGLLVEGRAEIALRGPRGPQRQRLDGLLVVDDGRLGAVPDHVVLDWHRRGWLALLYAHRLSQRRWGLLIDLAASVAPRKG